MFYIVLLASEMLPWLIVGICLGVLFLIGIFILLYKFVFIGHRLEKQIKDLERRYSYLDGLLIGQDAQYVKRLEMISRTNLLYVDIYNEYHKKFKYIFDMQDKYVAGIIRQLKTLIKNKQYKQVKKALSEGKKSLADFENATNELDSQLNKLIKPEEESRQYALRLKENLRNVKQTYNSNAVDLEIVSNSLNVVFDKLDHKFNEFEAHIESAEYEDANAMLPNIEKIIDQLKNVLQELPELCILVTKILPEKIKSVENESESLSIQNYPLHHLLLSHEFEEFNDNLSNLKQRLISLNIKDVKNDALTMQNNIENLHNNFRKEVDSKIFFDANCSKTYSDALDLEKNFLRLCSLLPEMNNIYKIDDEEQAKIKKLKEDINQLGVSKRSLDTFIHSSTPTPYSTLQTKLEKLIQDFEKVSQEVDNFKIYLESLKISSEDAYSLVFSYYYHLKQAELQLRNIAIETTINKYQDDIDQSYVLLSEIYDTLRITPIDVNTINAKVDALKSLTNELFDNINDASNVSSMAESAILYANRDRYHQIDVHQQLLLCEQQFFNGEFKNTYHDVVQLLKNKHVEEGINNN